MTHEDAQLLIAAVKELSRAVAGVGVVYTLFSGIRLIFGGKQ